MKRTQLFKRLLSLALVVAMLAVYAVPANAAAPKFTVEKVDNNSVTASMLTPWEAPESNQVTYADSDMVRVSIMLEEDSAIEAGFSTENFGANAEAEAYRESLKQTQKALTEKINAAIQGELDVVWNLTLAANLISANVAYGEIDTIGQIPGVRKVVLENRYDPQESVTDATAHPNMAISSQMVGSNIAWQSGLTGAGRRVAIIDTGLDLDHQSVDPAALEAAYRENAKQADMSYEEYVASLNLLDKEEIASVLSKLNVTERFEGATVDQIYQNVKAPFGYNYIDNSFYLTHDEDQASEHGSHVAGIAAANRLIEKNGEYVSAADSVGVVGNAPDAQILVMKVFGKAGGAYDSDYMAAIEDAIVLGCDSANLSLGSGAAGMVKNEDYQQILDSLAQTDTVVVISAGNNSFWSEQDGFIGLPYVDAPNFHTGGSPGTYENSLCVASVDNDGGVGYAFQVAGKSYMFTDSGDEFSNEPLASLDTSADGSGVTLDYVFINGVGKAEDYNGIDVKGKVVFCSRGETSFFEKGNIAAELGAAATVVYNNQPGIIRMDLTDYTHTQPCVSITQADGQSIAHDSVAAEGGKYLTGKITISNKMAMIHQNSDYLTMSAFSSWGVPGDLTMKPEITAPGGGIYSINGALPDTDQYELMSGTSMAAPQITGITALVMEAIEQYNLSQPDMTDRALAQSLMMSTATPLLNADSGCYYPVLQQGAGLVNTAAAVNADSFVTVVGMPDGKVKAELGDDAVRNGIYSFKFNLNNLTDTEKAYTLSADLFTQNVVAFYPNPGAAQNDDQSNLALFFDTKTTFLDSHLTSWLVNGAPLSNGVNVDLNEDGICNDQDAQMILDYVVGSVKDIPEQADISGDGAITSYDAHLLLKALDKEAVVLVPANGKTEIEVTLQLTAEDMAFLDEACSAGAYLQGYVYANAVADEEGAAGTSHSIPVLGYYGDWADNAMFDIGEHATYLTGEEERIPYLQDPDANSYGVTYADDPSGAYFFGGNPLIPDDVYRPERNAINSKDTLSDVSFTAIRNAGASRLTVVNPVSGQVLANQELGPVGGAYFSPNNGGWMDTSYSLNLGLKFKNLPENERFVVALTLASEYYVADDGSVNWDALGDAATFDMPLVVDNTAPVLGDVVVNEESGLLEVTASDNQYVSAVVLFNAAGNKVLAAAGAKQDIAVGATAQYDLSLADVNGRSFLLQVSDYAMNTTTYKISQQIGEELPIPEVMAIDCATGNWVIPSVTEPVGEAGLTVHSATGTPFIAATMVDHVVLAATEDGYLYAMPEYDLSFETVVNKLDVLLLDLAYNKADGQVYGVGVDGVLYAIDRSTGEMTAAGVLEMATNTLACDDNGNFYSNEFGTGKIYKYTLDTVASPELLTTVTVNGKAVTSAFLQAMEYNPTTGKVVWASCQKGGQYYLFEIDPASGKVVVGQDQGTELACLIFSEKNEGGAWGEPVDVVSGIRLSADEVGVLRGGTGKVSALVLPWNASDRTVSWSSDNEAVATVDAAGVITGVSVGTATITATSNLDSSVTASCVVNVQTLDVTLNGMLQGADSKPVFFDWNMAETATWTAGGAIDTTFVSVAYDSLNNVYYAIDDSSANSVHKIDANGKSLDVQANGAGVPLWDMAFSTVFSEADKPMVSSVFGTYLLSPEDPMNLSTRAFNLGDLANGLFAIASLGFDKAEDENGVMHDAEHVVLLADNGDLIHFLMYYTPDGMSANYEVIPSDLQHQFAPYANQFGLCSMVVGNDGNLYVSAFAEDRNILYRLTLNEAGTSYHADAVGDFGSDVWPVALTQVSDNNIVPVGSIDLGNLKHMDAEPVTAEQLLASLPEADTRAASGSLNAVTVNAQSKAPAELLPASAAGQHEKSVYVVDIMSDDVTTNGVYTFTYDPDLMYVDSVLSFSTVDILSYTDEDGVVTVAFAAADDIPADSYLAQIRLDVYSYHFDSSIEVVEVEHNADTVNRPLDDIAVHFDECPGEQFTDFRADKWYHQAIDFVAGHGLMTGLPNNEFGVYDNLTRSELVTILYRAAGEPNVAYNGEFSDVKNDKFYTEAVAWAVDAGIIQGYPDGTFRPYDDVNRAEMVIMIYRYAQYNGFDVSARADLKSFSDYDDVPEFAAEELSWGVATGLVQGVNEDVPTLAPWAFAARSEAATIIFHYMKEIEG